MVKPGESIVWGNRSQSLSDGLVEGFQSTSFEGAQA